MAKKVPSSMAKRRKHTPLITNPALVAVERAVSELRRGRPVIVKMNGEQLAFCAAELVTDNWMEKLHKAADTPPLIGLTANRANVLKISPRTGDTALVELENHMNSTTVQSMADPSDDLMKPLQGPFQVSPQGATKLHEAGIKLCKIARLLPAGVFSGPLDPAVDHGLMSVMVEDILGHTHHEALQLTMVTKAPVPLDGAEKTQIIAFRPEDGGTEHFAILIGDPNRHDPVLTRIHSQCFTGDLLGSLKCDCGQQLRGAIDQMSQAGSGVLLYLAQEGRDIGLINKLRAYDLQDQGFDTVDANERLGFLTDERIFEPAARMLDLMGFSAVKLMTNNPDKVAGLEKCGIKVAERVKHAFPSNSHNDHYLKTKKKRSGHLL